MNRSLFLLSTLLFGFYTVLQAQKPKPKYTTDIELQFATHIAGISKDTIFVNKGSTYSFTVDTPEDSGLVNTSATVEHLISQVHVTDLSVQQYSVFDKDGTIKKAGFLAAGDKLQVVSADGNRKKNYHIVIKPGAIGGMLWLEEKLFTVNTKRPLTLHYIAGQRSPDATVRFYFPPGISVTGENTTVNIIGRGAVKLKDLSSQSIGRTGNRYSYSRVGTYQISKSVDGSTTLILEHLDLRPKNGSDVVVCINDVSFRKTGDHFFRASYTTSAPEKLNSAGVGYEIARLPVYNFITDFRRVMPHMCRYEETADTYTKTSFTWTATGNSSAIQLLQSADRGNNWTIAVAHIDAKHGKAEVSGLNPGKFYQFKLLVKDGQHKGYSNAVSFYSGKVDIRQFDVKGDGIADDTKEINKAILQLSLAGGGTLFFSKGTYNVRTIHLQSNVYLYIDKGATIKAIKGADAPEATWFSDKKYRSGLSPTDAGPYADPENYLTKQDVGHHYFQNSMFFGERLENVKIIGNGRITGDGNLVTGDNVMKNAPDNRADKMFALKLCSDVEIGGLYRKDDLWYDSTRDEPYYIKADGSKDFDTENMLQIDRGGHFVLLATGTDNIYVHDTYFAKQSSSNARDIYDFMGCNNVTVTNIYSKVSSDDIVKPGSDCSLGFTRPARNYKVRNIIGDTNCNLFQIGSETADDIMDVHVDNIYVLGANKAGFSISTNDGAHIKDIHLNCGHTGTIHSRSKMYRSYTPFFISISNRGRILGAAVNRYKFDENGVKHDELLVTNINIGVVENVLINGIDVMEVYAGSSYGGKNERWKQYDGTQKRATPIVAGYQLPNAAAVEGGLNFTLPNGKHTGYIKNIQFNDVQVLVKGGNPITDTAASPPELGVGQYNASNLKLQPSWGLWARHVDGMIIKDCWFRFEKTDDRYVLFFDDVKGIKIDGARMMKSVLPAGIKLQQSSLISANTTMF
ncbi:MAG TPA: glycosyl hydrolase family 28-related protein [Chitinophagaceae bacterium]